MNKESLLTALRQRYISCNEDQYEKLHHLMVSTIEKNKEFNLTSITDEETFLEKMIFDSALSLYGLDLSDKKILDLGTGAGFPGLVLKILAPKGDFTLLDATKKKIDYLKEYSASNHIDCKFVNDRAEKYAHENVETFDYVVARAVSHLSILIELAVPLLKIGGTLIAYKGPELFDEIKESEKAFNKLGCQVEHIYSDVLPDSNSKRNIVYIKKTKSSPKKYPREYSEIKKLPL